MLPWLALLAGCTSVRPIVKIGLIAPFEGLYRESGYAALAAMRQALDECTPPGIDVLPLALDDSGDPAQAQRAAQKLLIDPAVRAIVGPLLLESIPAVGSVITPTTTLPWFVPSLVEPAGGFAAPESTAWLEAQINYAAAQTDTTRVLLLGLPTAWQPRIEASVPLLRLDDLDSTLAATGEGDLLLWLGRPDEGARWFAAIRQAHPEVTFWLAAQAGIDVFAAHMAATAGVHDSGDQKGVYWLLWRNSDYNRWSQPSSSAPQRPDATRYLTYQATCAALSTLGEGKPVATAVWTLQSQPVGQNNVE